MEDMVSWANLPGDVLCEIGGRLDCYEDYVRFRAVCVSWRSAVPRRPSQHDQFNQIPWLMISIDNKAKTYGGFYSFFDKKIHPLDLPEAKGKLCRGSSCGWLVLVDVEGGPELYLLNPVTRIQVALPPMSTLPNVIDYVAKRLGMEYFLTGVYDRYHSKTNVQEHYLDKVVLSSSPSSKNHDDYVAMAIYGETSKLAYCKSSDKKWTAALTPDASFQDITFHDGKFYAASGRSFLWVCDASSLPKMTKIDVEPPNITLGSRTCLAGSGSHGLVMVERLYDEKFISREKIIHYWTTGFKLYKLDRNECRYEWSKISSLDGNMLFLGLNSSLISIPSPTTPWLKGNHVYFADDYLMFHDPKVGVGGFDFGMFNLKDDTIHKLPGYKAQKRLLKSHGYKHDKLLVWPTPVWMVPNPCEIVVPRMPVVK